MRYEPAGAPEKPVLGLVGKGITFDTGGISIKPADGMEKMKYDMAGGATMIGAMRAIALLKPKVKVIGIVCATENMPSGKAQKPGDVQIAMSGKSIEIINTDAEGRLVLADGLFYARQLGCTHLVDAATLTGAVVVALGYNNAGIFANDDDMYNRFHSANAKAGEKIFRREVQPELANDRLREVRGSDAARFERPRRWRGEPALPKLVATQVWIAGPRAGKRQPVVVHEHAAQVENDQIEIRRCHGRRMAEQPRGRNPDLTRPFEFLANGSPALRSVRIATPPGLPARRRRRAACVPSTPQPP